MADGAALVPNSFGGRSRPAHWGHAVIYLQSDGNADCIQDNNVSSSSGTKIKWQLSSKDLLTAEIIAQTDGVIIHDKWRAGLMDKLQQTRQIYGCLHTATSPHNVPDYFQLMSGL